MNVPVVLFRFADDADGMCGELLCAARDDDGRQYVLRCVLAGNHDGPCRGATWEHDPGPPATITPSPDYL